MPFRSRGPQAAKVHPRYRGITGMPRSWRSSKARPRSMRTFWERCLSIKPAGSAGTDAVNFPMTNYSLQAATEADLARIVQFNRTEATFPDKVTLQELIEAQIDTHASDTAVICDHDKVFGVPSLTHALLNDKVNQLAHLLRAEGVRPGHVVALMVERSFAMIIGILGIVKAGGAYLPVAPDHPPDRIGYMLKDGGVKVLLVQKKTAGQIVFGGLIIKLD